MKKQSITFFSDSQHGWAGVKRSLLKEIGALDQISRYSYQKGATVYLEEDSDLSKFFNLFFESKGLKYESHEQVKEYFTVKESRSDRSAIRNYASFNHMTVEPSEVKQGQYIKVSGIYYFVEREFDGKMIIVKTAMGQRFKVAGAGLDEIFPVKEVA